MYRYNKLDQVSMNEQAQEFPMTFEQALLRMRMDGWCVLDGVIPGDEVAAVRDSVVASVEEHRNPDAPQAIGHVSGFIRTDQSLAPYLADRRVMELVEALVGQHARISFTTATINEPGNARGGWHADWPFNQRNAGHVAAPYADAVMHLTTIWMLSPFSEENGGTLVVSGSHRSSDNPTCNNGVAPLEPYVTELQTCGGTGSVLMMDSRLWHATAANVSSEPRVAVVVRYAPWWLNLEILRPGSVDRKRLVDMEGKTENEVPSIPISVFETFPDDVKPLFEHWVAQE